MPNSVIFSCPRASEIQAIIARLSSLAPDEMIKSTGRWGKSSVVEIGCD